MEILLEPTFFVDRSLGRIAVPQGLRAHGWQLVTLAEHYGVPADAHVQDEEWLALAGQRAWPVLMKDDRIRYRPSERRALRDASVAAFCLAGGNLKSADMVDLFVRNQREIHALAALEGPAFHIVSRSRRGPLSISSAVRESAPSTSTDTASEGLPRAAGGTHPRPASMCNYTRPRPR